MSLVHRSPQPSSPAPSLRSLLLLLVAPLAILPPLQVSGEGFRTSPPGAFNLGRAGGRIAQIDDASATTQNPANLTKLEATEIQLTPSVVYMSVEFDSAFGQSAETENPWKYLPNGYLAVPLKGDNDITLGLGITSPFGLSVDWDGNSSAFATSSGVLRYTTPYYTELICLNFNPTVAIKLCDAVSLGVGVDVMWSRLKLKQFYSWAGFPDGGGAPDGNLVGEGDGVGVGGNIGLTWNITKKQTLAVTYRSQMNVDYDGDTSINNITPIAAFLGVTSQSEFASSISYPNMVAVGYGIQITDTIRLETDVEWIQFSRFQSLSVDAGNNNTLFGGSPLTVPENWRDTWTFGIGGDWQFAEKWVLRAGYQYYQSPVPDSTFSPTIPDANQNVITIGLGYRGKHNSFEIAYGADFYDTRTITASYNPAFNGTYETTVHLFSAAYRYSF